MALEAARSEASAAAEHHADELASSRAEASELRGRLEESNVSAARHEAELRSLLEAAEGSALAAAARHGAELATKEAAFANAEGELRQLRGALEEAEAKLQAANVPKEAKAAEVRERLEAAEAKVEEEAMRVFERLQAAEEQRLATEERLAVAAGFIGENLEALKARQAARQPRPEPLGALLTRATTAEAALAEERRRRGELAGQMGALQQLLARRAAQQQQQREHAGAGQLRDVRAASEIPRPATPRGGNDVGRQLRISSLHDAHAPASPDSPGHQLIKPSHVRAAHGQLFTMQTENELEVLLMAMRDALQ